MRYESFTCVTRLIYMFVTRLIYMSVTRLFYMCVTRLIYIRDITPSYIQVASKRDGTRENSFICVS